MDALFFIQLFIVLACIGIGGRYGGVGGGANPATVADTHLPGGVPLPPRHLPQMVFLLTSWGGTGGYYKELE